ncbi:MAG TPA: YraN family protein [Prevotella sp.]
MASHNDLGKWGEETAVKFLREKGYTIRECDWKFGKRDIDVIALTPDETTVVFVEVKTRATDAVTSPEEAVNNSKIRSIGLAANAYVKMNNEPLELRFDVISIVGTNNENMRIEHIEDAFNPLLLF